MLRLPFHPAKTHGLTWRLVAALVASWCVFGACARPGAQGPTTFTYRVVRTFPHDPEAFTQGLIYRDGYLYESTGLNGRSTLRRVDLESGRVLQQIALDDTYFGEGLAAWRGELFQLTWQHQIGFVYDARSFARRRTFSYDGEGWGLTADAQHLILSDGSATLRFLNPETGRNVRQVMVADQGRPISNINELEYVKGVILANIWQTDRIAVVAPDTGVVSGYLDLTNLRPTAVSTPIDVLNGIAYDAANNRLFVTGKLWPHVYELAVGPGVY